MNIKSLTLFATLAALASAPADAGTIKRKIVRTTTVVTTTYYPAPRPPQVYVKPVQMVYYQRVPVYYPVLVQRFRRVQSVYFATPSFYRRAYFAYGQPGFRHHGVHGTQFARW